MMKKLDTRWRALGKLESILQSSVIKNDVWNQFALNVLFISIWIKIRQISEIVGKSC